VVVEQAINEYGPGQLEVTTRWADILKAADTFVTLRDTVRGTAEVAHGLMASFSPKPYPDAVGSGAHLHLSAWCDGANLFFNRESPREISVWGGHFIAGVLDHLPALVALTCPSFVSYERLKPQMWAGAVAAWGYDNRECPVRVASSFAGREENSANVEIKSVDASANPYLAAAGIIAAGLDGVRRELVPPAPAWHDPATLSTAERQACGVRDLPHSQDVALNLLEADEVLMAALGDLMGPLYLAVRRAEFERATAEGLAWAREHTFNVY
jgi:glutamine synthetase